MVRRDLARWQLGAILGWTIVAIACALAGKFELAMLNVVAAGCFLLAWIKP